MKTITNIKTLLILALVVLLSSNQNIAQNVGIGNESFTPDPSAMLEVKSTDKGMLVPRVDIADLSTAAPVTNPAVSLLVYNTNETTGVGFYYWDGNAWVAIGGYGSGSPCNTPSAPIAGTHIVESNQITWNWYPGSDELTFFKYNTINDFSSAIYTGSNNNITLYQLNCEQTYTLYVWGYNDCGNSDALILTQQSGQCPFLCGDSTVIDIDGNIYNSVLIGTQCWMKENLKVTRNPSGNNITRYCHSNNIQNCNIYGGLYNWHTAMNGSPSNSPLNYLTIQGICPNGWHMPKYSEWETLITNMGGTTLAGDKLKESGTTYWNSPNTGNNSSGFTALGGGRTYTSLPTYNNHTEDALKSTGEWWSSNEVITTPTRSQTIQLIHQVAQVYNYDRLKNEHNVSIRCIKD